MKGILLNSETGDILIDGNSPRMVIGDIAVQNAKLIIEANKGEFKEKPLKGVGISLYTEETTPERLVREIRREFFEEGLRISSLKIGDIGIELDVDYK
jgi:translation initiation factor IF-2